MRTMTTNPETFNAMMNSILEITQRGIINARDELGLDPWQIDDDTDIDPMTLFVMLEYGLPILSFSLEGLQNIPADVVLALLDDIMSIEQFVEQDQLVPNTSFSNTLVISD